jgi:protein-disulfide isomerase
MSNSLERIATCAIVVTAIVVCSTVVRREFSERTPKGNIVAFSNPAPTFVPDWKSFYAAGELIGDSTSKVTIIEFSDFECPFCKRFHNSYAEVKKKYGRKVSLLFVHAPITSHRFAMPAARAAECAREQSRFVEYVDVIFAKQDSLGLKSWMAYAADAGVADSGRFRVCNESDKQVSRIVKGLELSAKIGLQGTPTILINGWRYSRPPLDSLDRIVARLVAEVPVTRAISTP